MISLTCKDTKFMKDIYNTTDSYNPFSSSSPPQPSSAKIASPPAPPTSISSASDEFADALF